MFWGLVFVVVGVSLIVEQMFQIDIPMGRSILALVIIYFGIKMLFGSYGLHFNKKVDERSAVFGKSEFIYKSDSASDSDQSNYEVVFGEGDLDLTGIDLSNGDVKIKSDTVFGATRILVPKDVPIRIVSNTVFGKVTLPNKDTAAFGKFHYESPAADTAKHRLHLEIDVVFGSLELIEVGSSKE